MAGFDHAEMVEEETDAARLAERTGFENIPDFRRGAIPVIGQALHHDGHLVRSEALVGNGLEVHLLIGQAGAFLDGAFDGVAVNRVLAGFLDRRRKARVEVRVWSAQAGGHHDFANQFDDHLPLFLGIGFASGLFPLRAHLSALAKLLSS